MKPEKRTQQHQGKAMKKLLRERSFGSRRSKVAAKRAISLNLPPVDALAIFKLLISDYSRFGFNGDSDIGGLPVSFA